MDTTQRDTNEPRLWATFPDNYGCRIDVWGDTLEEIAGKLDHYELTSLVTVYDELGFLRGWARNSQCLCVWDADGPETLSVLVNGEHNDLRPTSTHKRA